MFFISCFILCIFYFIFYSIFRLETGEKEKRGISTISIMRSMTDSIIENILDTKNNISFDVMINAPLLLIIIANNKNDILAVDMGYIEIKTNENIWNVNCHDNDIHIDINDKKGKVKIDDNYDKNDFLGDYSKKNKNETDSNNLFHTNSNFTNFNNSNKKNNYDNNSAKSSYETLHISLSQIEIKMLNIENDVKQEKSEKSEIFNKKSKRSNFKKYSRLIDKFSINIEALISSDPWGTKHSPLKLFIDISEIKLR